MEPTATKPKNVFTNRNFTLAFLGALVSNIGNILYNFAVSFYILSLTDNNALIQGVYLAVSGVVFGVVVLFGGVISDRFHKGKIMFICDYAKGALLIALTLVLLFVTKENSGKIALLFVISILSNAIAGIFSPASSSLLPHIVPEESFQQAQSYYSLLQSFQTILGIVLAGILYSSVPIHVLFFVVGGCYLVSGFSEMFIRYDYQKKEGKLTVRSAFRDIGDAFHYLIGIKPILFAVLAILFVNFFFSPIFSNFEPYFLVTDVAAGPYLFDQVLSPEMWGSIFTVAFSLGSIILAIILSNRPKKEKIHKGLSLSFLLESGALALMAVIYVLFKNSVIPINAVLISFVVLLVINGALIVSINVPTSTTLISVIDKEQLGRVNSLVDVGSQGLIPLAEFLGGVVIGGLGTSALLIICTCGFIVMSLFITLNKEIRKL